MEITAQGRSWLKKQREKLDFSGKATEMFSPELFQIMEVLREIDDSVRQIAMGEKGSDPGQTLKDLLRVAQTNFNRREYITAVSYLGRFHTRMEEVNQQFANLTNVVDKVHHKFLFQDVDQDQVGYLTNILGPRFEKYKNRIPTVPTWTKEPKSPKSKEADVEVELVSEGGITDWWHNLTTERGNTLAAWEKRFPKYSKELKSQTTSMITRSQALLDNLIKTLKQLDSYRSTRKLEEYVQTANRWRDRFRAYNNAFIGYYNGQVRRFVDFQNNQEQVEEGQKDLQREELERGDTKFQENLPDPGNWPKPGEKVVSPSPAAVMSGGIEEDTNPQPKAKNPEAKQTTLPQQPSELQKQPPANDTKPKSDPYAGTRLEFFDTDTPRRRGRKEFFRRVRENKDPWPPPKPPPQPTLKELLNPSPENQTKVSPVNTVKTPIVEPPAPKSEPVVPVKSESAVYPLIQRKHPHETQRSPGSPPRTERESVIEVEPPSSAPETDRDLLNPNIPPPPLVPRELRDTTPPRRSHQQFLTSLETLSSRSAIEQAAYILNYATEIETEMPEECSKLRKLASVMLRS
jgi:hypothetical protein